MPSHALEVLKSKVCNLDGLAKRIDAAHAAVQTAFQAVAQRAIEAGQLLIQAKSRVPHGEWEAWIAQNTAVSLRTARAYMQIARHWMEADEANRQRVADLSLRAMLTELASPIPFKLPAHRVQSDDLTSIVTVREVGPKTIIAPIRRVESADHPKDEAFESKKAAWLEADLEKLERRRARIRAKLDGPTQDQIERRIDEAVLSCHDANVLAALRLMGRVDLETLARVSKLDENINLEELAGFLSDAAVQALK